MTQRSLPLTASIPRRYPNLWFERLMVAIAVANFGLVMFDLTYVPWHDFWLLGRFQIPLLNLPIKVPMPSQITQWYDSVKGIEPNRDTQQYLETVSDFKQVVSQQGLRSPAAQRSLSELQELSTAMIDTNPFALANKSGALEKIKRRMRDRIYGTKKTKASASAAFNTFWSADYLVSNYQQEIAWFDENVTDLIRTNYYRSISESGDFTNNFGAIDAPFAILFLVEFLARTFYLSRRYTGVTWFDTMLWRWYDGLLFFPFGVLLSGWAWLRVVPIVIRLHQAQIINLTYVRDQAVQSFVGNIANELTEVVIVQAVDQAQAAIRRGEISRLLAVTGSARLDINNVDEVAELTDIFLKLTVQHVLPKVQPELAALVSQSVDVTLSQLPSYRILKALPGVGILPGQLNERLSNDLLNGINTTLGAILSDSESEELIKRVVQKVSQAYGAEIQQQMATSNIQALLLDLLEEIKLSYVQRPTEIPAEVLLEETRQLRQVRR